MIRRAAFADPETWVGTATTEPGVVSAWHHHGDHTTYIFCARGGIRIESGPGGSDAVEGRAGDFIKIPPHVVHREANPSDDEQLVVLARVGSGPIVVNVDEPDPA